MPHYHDILSISLVRIGAYFEISKLSFGTEFCVEISIQSYTFRQVGR